MMALHAGQGGAEFIRALDSSAVKLKLARDRSRSIWQGYPWIYRDWLEELPKAPPGTRALVRDRDGSLIAFGMYDPESPIAVRICAVGKERLDSPLIESRFNQARRLREESIEDSTDGYRLFNGEGDGLPGLVCDLYRDVAVIKLDGAAPEGFWNIDGIASWLATRLRIRAVYLKYRSDAESRGKLVAGDLPPSIEFLEYGARYEVDIVHGQKTGFFFDQRENRRLIRLRAKGRQVLNLFSYTGGFSVAAGLGGATSVTSVDIAKPAIAAAEQNWRLNGLSKGHHTGVSADVFEYLNEARAGSDRWNLIVVDPPSFAPAERHVPQAREKYVELFSSALQVAASESVVALSSCSSHIPFSMFDEICREACAKARRSAKVIGIHGQPADHPFPLVCQELRYLKFYLLALR